MRFLALALIGLAQPVLAEVPRVVTDLPPVQALVAQVMGDLGAPVLLLEKGADEHDFQMRPSQRRALAGADLVVWIGPELTPWLERGMAGGAAQSLALLDADGTYRRPYGPEVEDDGHGHDDHGNTDPHAWLDPNNAAYWAALIAHELGQIDPEHAEVYAGNAAAAQVRIAAMDAQIAGLLAPMKARGFVTFHAAYGYFAAHYGLTGAGALALGDAATPGAARLAGLRADLEAGRYICAFPEVQHDPALMVQLLDGTGVKLGAALDPVGSSLDAGPDGYEALMLGLAQKLADCLKG